MVGRVELLVLDAGPGVVLGEGEDARKLQRVAHAIGAGVAVTHAVTNATVLPIEQHVVDGPGVNAHGRRLKARLACGGKASDHVLCQGVNVPAKMAALA